MQYKSSFFLFILKILGFFWCEWDSCIPTLIAKNTRFFLFYQVPFEGSYSYDTPSDWLLYRPLQTLLGHLTTFLESRCSVIFILNPITGKFISKIFTKSFPGPPIPDIFTYEQWLQILVGGKIFNSILQYTHKKPYKSSVFSIKL